MKKRNKIILVTTAILMISAMSITAFAASAYSTPAQAAAEVSGKTLDEVYALRQEGKTYGTIAADADKLDEFKSAILEIDKASLDACVSEGTMTQAEADKILADEVQRQALCDGTGNGNGAYSHHNKRGTGGCGGRGTGRGMHNRACINQ